VPPRPAIHARARTPGMTGAELSWPGDVLKIGSIAVFKRS